MNTSSKLLIFRYYSITTTGTATVEFLEKQFILKQMFLIIKTYDCADVASRDCLNSLVSNTLEKVDLMSDVIETVVKCLENSIPEINSRSRFVSEIISEIMFPLDPEVSQEKEREKEFEVKYRKKIMFFSFEGEKLELLFEKVY